MDTVARHRSLLVACSVLSLIGGGLLGFFTPHPSGRSVRVVTPEATATALPTATPAPLRIYVSGAVANPAVYRLAPGSLVADAVQAAGGATGEADMDRINLAQELLDQQHVLVPRRDAGEAAVLPSGVETPPVPALVNINTATAEELDALPQIGPATAQSIVEYRQTFGPFTALEELLDVPGVGPATLDEIRALVSVGQ